MPRIMILMTCAIPSLCQSQDKNLIIPVQYESIKPEIVQRNTRLLSWKLGTNLGWTFALRFRYPPQLEDKLFQSLEKTNFIAKKLGVTEITWPEARGARSINPHPDTGVKIVDYMKSLTDMSLDNSIIRQLILIYGDEHAFYFNIAMECMVAYIFYEPNSLDNSNLIKGLDEADSAIKKANGDPNFQSVWKPVVDAIKQSLPPDVVFSHIQEMDNKMSHDLANDQRN